MSRPRVSCLARGNRHPLLYRCQSAGRSLHPPPHSRRRGPAGAFDGPTGLAIVALEAGATFSHSPGYKNTAMIGHPARYRVSPNAGPDPEPNPGPARRQKRASGARRSPANARVEAVAGVGSRSRCQHGADRRQRDETRATPIAQEEQPRGGVTDRSRVLQWNATSHADRHGHDCPSAPAMQHSGGADVTVALHR